MKLLQSKLTWIGLEILIAALVATSLSLAMVSYTVHSVSASTSHAHINCATGSPLCTEVYDTEKVFGENHYVGHDEPSTLFYSNVPGSGNRMQYQLQLPKDPAPTPLSAGKAFNFQLHIAFWFGMAMCDTQSFPELLNTCTPDSDKNIVDPAISPNHPGMAFMEMQFYPPGWTPWPAGISCDPTKWCAALNIDSLSENPVTGQVNNNACLSTVGIEPVNFAFITKSGVAQAPANPVDATAATYTPDPAKDLFMNSGDNVAVNMHDTANGLKITLNDSTTGQSGSMTASKANGFGQVKFDPTGSTCTSIPYDFHPMYSTSSEQTRVTWAAHSYNIAFADEIGHFDYCSTANSDGTCSGTEGTGVDQEPTDSDDLGCFPASTSTLVKVSGCLGTNTGFDGTSYQPVWPDGNYKLHPTPIKFSSPLTGSNYTTNYSRMAFEADLPRIEANSTQACDRTTGANCTLIPETDDSLPAPFYPFFSTAHFSNSGCAWQIGNHIPGSTNDFHQNAQYGTLLNSTYTTTGGGYLTRYNNFRQILSMNPCSYS